MKAALIGCGRIARQHLEPLFQQGITVCGLCDTVPERAEELITEMNLSSAKVYTDYRKMIDIEKPDSVHICAPHYLHTEMSVYALEKGVNVLLEKPVCINLEELELIKAATDKSNGQLGVCFQNRFLDSYRYACEYLADKDIKSIAATVFWSRDREYYESESWRGKWATEGGGVLINQAIHTLDFIHLIGGGAKKLEASASLRYLNDTIEVEDFAEAYMELESGARVLFIATNALSRNYPVNIKVDCGCSVLEILGDALFIDGKLKEFEKPKNQPVLSYWGLGHYKLIENFYSCIKQGKTFEITLEEGAKSLKTIFEIYEMTGIKTK